MRNASVRFSAGLLALAALILSAMPVASAAQPRQSSPVQEQREERREQRAESIGQRVELVIARFENNCQRHINTYNAVKAECAELIGYLEGKGYDCGRLKTDLQTWDQMIVKAARDYASFIGLLRAAQAHDPLASRGQFKAAVEQARAQLRVFRQDVLDVRHYYQTVIRSDILAVRSQTPSPENR